MRSIFMSLLCLVFISGASSARAQSATLGATAPDFTLTDSTGKTVLLSSFRGKHVVLEWFNPQCPFVKKFYAHGDMQNFQQKVLASGDVWLTINSSAPGKQGYISQASASDVFTELALRSTALLLDPNGTVGKMYGARTTPHMFIVDAKGTLVYAGAIDSVPSTDFDDVSTATNYVLSALEAVRTGNTVSPSATEPYGCSVKY